MRWLSMTVPRSALLVSSSGDSAVTVICSVTPPTPSCTLTSADLADLQAHVLAHVLLEAAQLGVSV